MSKNQSEERMTYRAQQDTSSTYKWSVFILQSIRISPTCDDDCNGSDLCNDLCNSLTITKITAVIAYSIHLQTRSTPVSEPQRQNRK